MLEVYIHIGNCTLQVTSSTQVQRKSNACCLIAMLMRSNFQKGIMQNVESVGCFQDNKGKVQLVMEPTGWEHLQSRCLVVLCAS